MAESRFSCFKQRFEQQLATDSVPAFNYIVLPSDHTNGSAPGTRTPRSAIFVIEDDSQDGPDHVDAHRMPAAVFSPYAKRGAVIHTRYDQLSVMRTMEIILGMRPLALGDARAVPMYDVFNSQPSNGAPYDVLAPSYPLLERNPNTPAARDFARHYNYVAPDRIPQDVFDRVLWESVHGAGSRPPAPGPNAARGQ